MPTAFPTPPARKSAASAIGFLTDQHEAYADRVYEAAGLGADARHDLDQPGTAVPDRDHHALAREIAAQYVGADILSGSGEWDYARYETMHRVEYESETVSLYFTWPRLNPRRNDNIESMEEALFHIEDGAMTHIKAGDVPTTQYNTGYAKLGLDVLFAHKMCQPQDD